MPLLLTISLVFMIVSIQSIMNYDIMKPAFAQDMAFAEPEEDENGGPYDNDNNENNPDFNFATAGDFGCGDEAKRTVNNIKAKDPELVILTGDLSYQKYGSLLVQVR